ncbi:MAG: F0F1 ATP synthase subunit B [Nostocoides sp.]
MILTSVPMAEGPGWPDALPLLPHPMEILIGLISFGILYWLFAKMVVPRMEALYAERAAAIEGGMKQAEEAQEAANAALEQYQDQLREARGEANKIREDARTQGSQIVAELRDQAQAEASRITESAKKQIDAERQSALVSLRNEVGTMSADLASRIVGESLQDEARQTGIIDRFLAEFEAGEVAPASVGETTDPVR